MSAWFPCLKRALRRSSSHSERYVYDLAIIKEAAKRRGTSEAEIIRQEMVADVVRRGTDSGTAEWSS
jgi:hypothetical protein